MSLITWRSGVFFGALAGLAWVAAPQPVQACGGMFCDSGPQSMPIDQSGENILFILDGNEVEAHIQIQYQGDPEEFAWVIPLTAVPDFSIGSEQLFDNLLAGTVPTYGYITTRDQCSMPGRPSPSNDGQSLSSGGFGSSGADETGDGGESGPQVVLRETVGAYEIAVLEGGTPAEVIEWLDTNGYQQDPEAEPILGEYLAENHLFGAIKLSGGAGVDQIHPIVLRYRSDEPCIPLRLTRIAAVDDMEVRTFFLGNDRMVPTNYRHVLVNPLKLDWLLLADNYKEVITGAVDAEHANGRAFVTEYAGTSNVVTSGGLTSPGWNPEAFRGTNAQGVANLLLSQGLATCNEWDGCQLIHPLIGGVVAEFLELPTTVEQYLDDPVSYSDAPWDGEGFADAFAERIVGPGEHAQDLLSQWPYVTRMYTTISPHEMTEDPIFHPRSDLDDVDPGGQGTRRIMCNGDELFTLPDGREVFIPNGNGWPNFPDEMPWEQEVSEIPLSGAPVTLSDRNSEIDELLGAYNTAAGYDPNGCQGCSVEEKDGSRGRWALGLVGLVLGAGVFGRRRRKL